MKSKDDPKLARFYDVCFGKRPAIELYDCQKDPDQVSNLANDPGYAGTVKKLREKLAAYLKETEDPRFTDKPVKFDEYPYLAAYLKKYMEKHGYTL